ncbi:MAG: CRISP-associated protein Cas1 [Clostridiales bacterium]|jgi:CRISPR-associated protein Cas1|nr:CRISP-associated protein Cas1 [Clostridiales bacterium]MDN5283530.1 CRISP-associated protein Cas1 [Candidatus Ozemobacter sp.]
METGTIYVNAQGSRLTRVGERLVIRSKENRIIEDVPFFRLVQVVVFGNVELTGAAMGKLIKSGIDIIFLTITGRFKYRLDNFNKSAIKCRLSQYQKSLDDAFRLKIARSIVKGKILNSKNWLVKRNRPASADVSASIWKLKSALEMTENACSIDELMGIEGIAAKDYFSGLKHVLKQDLGFNERNRRPPRDPVNAMLSFGYMLLLNYVTSAIEQVGLDPMLANLHAVQDRRPSLALDLIEEFRCSVVDTVVTRLVNLVRIQPRDFFYDSRKGIRMREEAIGLFISEIQARLRARFPDPVTKKQFSLKDLIVKQAYQYKSLILNEKTDYQAVIIT